MSDAKVIVVCGVIGALIVAAGVLAVFLDRRRGRG